MWFVARVFFIASRLQVWYFNAATNNMYEYSKFLSLPPSESSHPFYCWSHFPSWVIVFLSAMCHIIGWVSFILVAQDNDLT